MTLPRFLLLLEEALRDDAVRHMAALEASAYPYMEERARSRLVHDLRWSLLTPEEQVEQVDGNWASLRQKRGLH